MKLKLNVLAVLFATLFILASCGGGNSGGGKGDAFEEAKSLEDEITHLVSEDFPRPSEIPYMVMQTGADYNQSLINSRQGLNAYLANPEKSALNLGVYAADMGYLASYDKTQESIDFFNSCKQLADELGIIQGFDPAMVNRVESNIGNRDSLTSVLDEAVGKAAIYVKSQYSKTGALIIAGSFVESLYLATGIIKSYPNTAYKDAVLVNLTQVVIKQSSSVDEVMEMLNNPKIEKSETINGLIKDFAALQASYVPLKELQSRIAKGDPNLAFNEQTLAAVTKTVESIRSNIVN